MLKSLNKIWKLWTLKNKLSDDKLFDIDGSAFYFEKRNISLKTECGKTVFQNILQYNGDRNEKQQNEKIKGTCNYTLFRIKKWLSHVRKAGNSPRNLSDAIVENPGSWKSAILTLWHNLTIKNVQYTKIIVSLQTKMTNIRMCAWVCIYIKY